MAVRAFRMQHADDLKYVVLRLLSVFCISLPFPMPARVSTAAGAWQIRKYSGGFIRGVRIG